MRWEGAPETHPAGGGEYCEAGNLSLVLLCQPVKLLPATVGAEEGWLAGQSHWEPVLKAG